MPSGKPDSSPTKHCEQCNGLFKFTPSVEKKGFARYCSKDCHNTWQSISKKGKAPYEITPENRKNRSLSRIGKRSKKFGKKYPHLQGINHWRWEGGKTSESEKQRVRFRRVMQQKIFQRDNYTCQICEQYSGYLQVDHIKKWADFPELRFELDNCRTLCMACHYYITFKRKFPQGVVWGHNLNQRITK